MPKKKKDIDIAERNADFPIVEKLFRVIDSDTVAAYQKRKQEIVTHPFLNEKMTLGLVPHIQARPLLDILVFKERHRFGIQVVTQFHGIQSR